MKVRQKKFLRRNIIFVFSLLVGALFTVFVYGWIVLDNYHRQVDQNVIRMLEFYTNSINSDFEKINTQILNLLLRNGIIQKELPAIQDVTSGHGTLELINAQNKLNQNLYELAMNYGDGYNLWYYNKQYDIYCESGNGDYAWKRDFRNYITDMCQTEQEALTRQQHWFLVDTGSSVYAVSAYRMGLDYVGCWIKLWDLVEPLMRLDMIDSGGIYVYDAGQELFQLYHKDRTMKDDVEMDALAGIELSALKLQYADFEIGVIGTDVLQKQVFLYQSVMVSLGVISVLFMLWMIHFIKRAVLQPLLFFSKSIERFKNTGSFDSDNLYEEFEDAGRLLKELEDKIRKLEVSIYEERIEKQKVELDYAQLQIRPHFYINCMNNIYSLAQMKRYYEIEDLSIYVSNYLRGIFRKGMVPVPLQEEIESIQNYLEIHKILYRNGFAYSLSVEETVRGCRIPPLLIQVFVENSIKHTMASDEEIDLCIRAVQAGDKLHIGIYDNGPGFPEELLGRMEECLADRKDSRFQIGLHNAVVRLRMLYAQEAKVLFSNGEDGGAHVDIYMPAEPNLKFGSQTSQKLLRHGGKVEKSH